MLNNKLSVGFPHWFTRLNTVMHRTNNPTLIWRENFLFTLKHCKYLYNIPKSNKLVKKTNNISIISALSKTEGAGILFPAGGFDQHIRSFHFLMLVHHAQFP